MNDAQAAITFAHAHGKFADVWTWGNPLMSPPQSDRAAFEGFVFYRTMSTVVQRNFWRTRRSWLRLCDHMQVHEDHLIEVALLDREAKKLGFSPAKYIAHRIGKSERTVYRYLELIDLTIAAEILPTDFGEKSNFIPLDSSMDTSWKPSAEMIQRKRLAVPRLCAAGMPGCAGTTASGQYPLCLSCSKHFPMDKQDTWEERTKKWLLPEIRRIENEHRNQVIEILYEEHHNMLSGDVQDYADFAASGTER